jgi:hypothetical protein
MNLQRLAGMALIASFVFLILNFVVGPPGVSQAPDVETALQAIRDQQGLYVLANVISGIAVLLPAVGFLLLALRLRGKQNPWPINLGTAAFLIGALLGLIHVYRITVDPRPYLETVIERVTPPTLFTIFGFVILAGAFLFGVAFLQSGLPKWVGYMLTGYAAISAAVVLITGIPVFPAVMLLYLIYPVVGIVLLRRPVARSANVGLASE